MFETVSYVALIFTIQNEWMDGWIDWGFICAAPVCSDEERTKLKNKALDLPAGRRSDSHLQSYNTNHDRKNETEEKLSFRDKERRSVSWGRA